MSMKTNGECVDIIGRNRVWLLGVATIWVALFHSYWMDFSKSLFLSSIGIADFLNFVKRIGNSGVDIFLLLSGYGLYYSFYNDNRILPFYKKRLLRILPALFLVEFIYYGVVGTNEFSVWLQKSFLYGFWIPGMQCGAWWYFSLLMVCYIVFPVIFHVINKYDIVGTILLIVVAIFAALLLRKHSVDYFIQIEIGLTRIPVFLGGGIYWKEGYEQINASREILFSRHSFFNIIPSIALSHHCSI